MSRIVEVLTADNSNIANLWSFTVDNTKAFVTVVGGDITFCNDRLNTIFSAGDNIGLLSIGLPLPNGYNLKSGEYTGALEAYVFNISGPIIPILNTWLPFGSYEMAVDGFYNHRSYAFEADRYLLKAKRPQPINIDMVGIPDSENGKTYYISPFVKIAHSLELEEV